jgi:hypothetical protein
MNDMQNNVTSMKMLRILYFGMLGGTIFFSGIFYFIGQDGEPGTLGELKKNIFVAMLFVAAVVLTAASFMWNKDIRNIRQGNNTLPEKFNAYRAASIKRYALIEFAALLSAIFYFLTKEPKLYVVIGILIVYFLSLYPSASRISKDTGENVEDIDKL